MDDCDTALVWDGLSLEDRESIIADWLTPCDNPPSHPTIAQYEAWIMDATQCIYRLLGALCQAEAVIAGQAG